MSVTATFLADFSSFDSAVDKSELKLKSFSSGAAGVEKALARIGNAFSGQKVLQEAALAVKAVDGLGGASKLTSNEQQRLNGIVTEALAKYRALGIEAPAAMLKLQHETTTQTSLFSKFAGMLGPLGPALAGIFTVGAVVGFGKELLRMGDELVKVHDRTGLTIKEVQQFSYAAEQSGNTLDDLTAAIGQMQNRLASGDKSAIQAVKELGLDLKALTAAGPGEQMRTLAAAIGAVENPATRTALRIDLFGKAGATAAATLGADFNKIADSAATMSDDTVRSLDKAGDAMNTLGRTVKVAAAESVNWLVDVAARAGDLAFKFAGMAPPMKAFDVSTAMLSEGQSTLKDVVHKTAEELAKEAKAIADAAAAAKKLQDVNDKIAEARHEIDGLAPSQQALADATAKVVVPLGDLETELQLAARHGLDATEMMKAFGAKADTAAASAAAAHEQVGKLTAALAAQFQLSEAHKAEQIGTAVPNFGPTLPEFTSYWDSLFKAKDTLETGSIARSGQRAIAAAHSLLALDTLRGESAQKLASDVEALETQTALAGIAAENQRFALESVNIDKATDLYKTLAENHAGIVAQMNADWQAGIDERKASTLSFSNAVTNAFGAIGPSILAAVQGGGDVLKSVGSAFGGSLTKSIFGGAAIQKSISDTFSKTLGGAFNAILPGIGAIAGPLLSKLAGLFGGIFGGPNAQEKAGRAASDAFAESLKGMLSWQQQIEVHSLVAAGNSQKWAEEVLGLRSAYEKAGLSASDADAMVQRLFEAEKQGGAAVQAVIDQITLATGNFTDATKAAADAAKAEADQIKAIEDSFSGTKTLHDAEAAVTAVTKLGGVTKLTAAEQKQLHSQLEEAIQKYEALGMVAPDAMVAIANATADAVDNMKQLTYATIAAGAAALEVERQQKQQLEAFLANNYVGAGGSNADPNRQALSPENYGSFAAYKEAFLRFNPGDTHRLKEAIDTNSVRPSWADMPAGFAGGTGGRYLDFGSGTSTTLHGRERVMTEAEGAAEGGAWALMAAELASIHVLLKGQARMFRYELQRIW